MGTVSLQVRLFAPVPRKGIQKTTVVQVYERPSPPTKTRRAGEYNDLVISDDRGDLLTVSIGMDGNIYVQGVGLDNKDFATGVQHRKGPLFS